jgi:hydroxyacylglutathione hydrolase
MRLDLDALESRLRQGALVVDTRAASAYAPAHIPGTINIPLDASFTTWAGWLVPYTSDFFLIVDDRDGRAVDALVRDLAMIGLDRVGGWFDAAVVGEWAAAGRGTGAIPQITVGDLRESLAHQGVTLIDVRSQNEWAGGHIEGARHIPLGYLPDRLDEVSRARPIVVQCAAGARSAIGASLLRAHGVDRVINLVGGIGEWRKAGLPTVQ